MQKAICLGLVATAISCSAFSGVQNDVPSCYAANPKLGKTAPVASHELFVLIDQTTQLDRTLRQSVLENVGRLIKPGNAFTVATFSSFAQGRYMTIENAGTLETGLSDKERDDVAASALKSFDACMSGQFQFAAKLAANALNKAFEDTSGALVKSDVLASIKELSVRVKASPAKDRIIFMVSDMLENSSISTFYANQNVRKIDPVKEIAAVKAAKMFGDFGGARVFILGAGVVPDEKNSARGIYRDPKAIAALKDFWTEYFKKSGAEVVEFGQPALMIPVQ